MAWHSLRIFSFVIESVTLSQSFWLEYFLFFLNKCLVRLMFPWYSSTDFSDPGHVCVTAWQSKGSQDLGLETLGDHISSNQQVRYGWEVSPVPKAGAGEPLFRVSWSLPKPRWCISNDAGIILCVHPANERWPYNVTSPLIGWAHIRNDPWWWDSEEFFFL